jgi:hypothetical protein
MSVYVGVGVHRKRSQVAVVSGDGKVRLNRNPVNGAEPILKLIDDLPTGTAVAFEAAFGWGWLTAPNGPLSWLRAGARQVRWQARSHGQPARSCRCRWVRL